MARESTTPVITEDNKDNISDLGLDMARLL
jgi:hypothetical protein